MASGNAIQLNGTNQYIQLDETVTGLYAPEVNEHIAWREYWSDTDQTKVIFGSDSGNKLRWLYESGVQKIELSIQNFITGVELSLGSIPTGWTSWQFAGGDGNYILYRDNVQDIEINAADSFGGSTGMYVGFIGAFSGTDYSDSIFSDFVIFVDPLNLDRRTKLHNNIYPYELAEESLWYRLNDVDTTNHTIVDYSNSGAVGATIINGNNDCYYTGYVPYSFNEPNVVGIRDHKTVFGGLTDSNLTISDLVHSSGDLLISWVYNEDSDNLSSRTINTPAGWTAISTGVSNANMNILYKLADSSGSYNFTWDVNPTGISAVTLMSITGNHPNTSVESYANVGRNTRPLTTTRDNFLIHAEASQILSGDGPPISIPNELIVLTGSPGEELFFISALRQQHTTGIVRYPNEGIVPTPLNISNTISFSGQPAGIRSLTLASESNGSFGFFNSLVGL